MNKQYKSFSRYFMVEIALVFMSGMLAALDGGLCEFIDVWAIVLIACLSGCFLFAFIILHCTCRIRVDSDGIKVTYPNKNRNLFFAWDNIDTVKISYDECIGSKMPPLFLLELKAGETSLRIKRDAYFISFIKKYGECSKKFSEMFEREYVTVKENA